VHGQAATVTFTLPIITDKYHKNKAFSLMKCTRRYVQSGSVIIVVLFWRNSIHFWRILEYMRRNDFYNFVPSDLWTLISYLLP